MMSPSAATTPYLQIDQVLKDFGGGAIAVCKSVGLKGNPVSPMAKKSVAKALKKAKSAAPAMPKP